ncbi:hypothetical protein GVN16_05955 [Emticicia sp. CRIBPO]|uniref:hypothetical protein n=1 Tax=Emticicia sp. CRIBPO TaxID=2683258 RepID=UPI001411F675|nr:hypothetical protein [Emticicia sp. CRIBPO]NBA85295.1 hypothetical protein [Emticicia sp. CRIBPO]
MRKYLITTFLFLFSSFCFSQSLVKDTINLLRDNKKIIAVTFLDFKSNKVLFKNPESGKRDFVKFEDIESLKSGYGGRYVPRIFKDRYELLFQMIEGNHSLYYQPRTHRYYIQSPDTLLFLSKRYFKDALKLIYGEKALDEYAVKSNLLPNYSSNYLVGFIDYVNNYQSKPHKRSAIKTSIEIGTLFLAGPNELNIVKGNSMGRTLNGGGGISLGLKLNNTFRFGFDAYYLSEYKDLKVADTHIGWAKIITPDYVVFKGFYESPVLDKIKMSFVVLEPNIKYYVFNKLPRRFNPYLFGGPSFVKASGEMKLHLNYFNGVGEKEYKFYRETRGMESIGFRGGVHGGIGGALNVSDKIKLDLSVRYLRVRFDKTNFSRVKSIENTTPLASDKILFQDLDYIHILSNAMFINFSLKYSVDIPKR